MRKIVILGSGAGGTILANNLRKELDDSEWQITVIDRDEQHHFQAGYLFIPFGIYTKNDVLKPKKEFIPQDVEFVVDNVVNIDRDQRRVVGEKQHLRLRLAGDCHRLPHRTRRDRRHDGRLGQGYI